MDNLIVEIDSQINEIYSKTIVTQKFENQSNEPIELKIYVYKAQNSIFSSFSAQIGDSIQVKSKVIKEEKAKEKYTDAVSSGNAAIFVSQDPNCPNRIIINLGNIPPKTNVIFISEFLQLIESSEQYEFEIFRNLPILVGKYTDTYQYKSIIGKIELKTKNKIIKIEKKLLNNKIKINEEKFLDEDRKNYYLIKYEYNNLGPIYLNNYTYNYYYSSHESTNEYIPSSKIFFEVESNEPIIYSQKSLQNPNETNYIIQYKCISKNSENNILNPALFIFLLDQSGSMSGDSIKVASEALLLFLQSLPVGSYYQIIGFGSQFKAYDNEPKQYNEKNIKKSIELIKNLKADLGGTNIYKPLNFIYNSNKLHDKIKLPRNIFLLTDGDIQNKQNTLSLIENNSDKYFIYSIGIGSYFDEDLIKNAGVIGKGSYNFCKNIENLNEVIASELNKALNPYFTDFQINSFLDEKNNVVRNKLPDVIKSNEVIDLLFIVENENIEEKKIKVDINYIEHDINKKDGIEKKSENFEIEIYEIKRGNELSKLIINKYLLSSDLNNEEKIKLALKYQLFTNGTSLFAEVELSEKITEEMKLKIIGDKDSNVIEKVKINVENYTDEIYSIDDIDIKQNINYLKCLNSQSSSIIDEMNLQSACICGTAAPKKSSIFSSIGRSIKNFFSFNKNKLLSSEVKEMSFGLDRDEPEPEENNDSPLEEDFHIPEEKNDKSERKDDESEEKVNEKDEKEVEKVDEDKRVIKDKNSVMKIINTQDFIQGFWDVNDSTKIIKDKYQKEFDLLKGLEGVDEKVAMTILIIYFVSKEHNELLKQLVLIIKKGKQFIQKIMKDSYENIIKKVGLD